MKKMRKKSSFVKLEFIMFIILINAIEIVNCCKPNSASQNSAVTSSSFATLKANANVPSTATTTTRKVSSLLGNQKGLFYFLRNFDF